MTKIKDIRIYVAMLAAAAFAFVACTDKDDEWEIPFDYSATIQYSTIGYDQTTNSITTSGDSHKGWVAQMDDATAKWCSFSSNAYTSAASGHPGESITIYIDKNDGTAESRTANIKVTFTNSAKTVCDVSFTQKGYSANAGYDRDWGEQPANNLKGSNLIYKTYYTTLASASAPVRNYSVCFDTEKMVSRWVAYPVHTVYTNSRNYKVGGTTQGRTNAWAFDDAVTEYLETNQGYNYAYDFKCTYDKSLDTYNTHTEPIIPQKYQQNIGQKQASGSIYSGGGSPQGYNRGHMLPSASRYSTWNTNAQTFYATNMMPQNGSFNSGSWGDVEDAVRKMACNDTLFVVVGTLFENAQKLTTNGRTITVPSHCFKLLLRTKTGTTKKKINEITDPNDLICIGFLYENSASAANKTFSQAVVSVAEVEERSGFQFFHNINPQIADKVKSQKNLNDWAAFK